MNKFRMTRAGINVNEGIERLCGDVPAYEKMLESYLDCTYLEQLKENLEKKDVEASFQSAHALKGVAGNLSLAKLYEALFPVVEELRGKSIAVEEYMPALEEANNKVIAAIKDMVEK